MCQVEKQKKRLEDDEKSRQTHRMPIDEWSGAGSAMEGIGWTARGDKEPTEKRIPFNRPTARQVYDALPFVRRYFVYWMKHTGKKEKLFINTFQPLQHKPFYGVPCGGIGCGSLGRDFRGGFCKFGLRPGLIEHKVDVIPADQFILSVRRPGENRPVYQKVLCAADVDRSGGQLSAWDFDFPRTDLTYRGLYPRSWTCYYISELSLLVTVRQISPVLPHNYEDSSLPVCSFVFEAENRSDEEYEISIAFTFRNGTGRRKYDVKGECASNTFGSQQEAGVSLRHTLSDMPCTYGLAAEKKCGSKISLCRSFHPSLNGLPLWKYLAETGDVPDHTNEPTQAEQGVAVCVRSRVAPHSVTENAHFALSWDMPNVRFGTGQRTYKRRYTRFFGSSGDAASVLCTHAIANRMRWEEAIEEWQRPVIQHPHLPSWYKSALFNELYFMTDGGSIWFEFDEKWAERETHLSRYSTELMKEHGRFGYLESWEYRMVTTYDVHFYASYAIAELWPKLELAIQAEFTDQIEHVEEALVKFHMEGDKAPQKTRARVPHDLGNPAVDPWLLTNAYVMHDTGKWKDLNLKFILTSWRDYVTLVDRDPAFLRHVYPAVKSLIGEALLTWDKDGDGMIENFGKADQTYDAWQMEGVSAYCGSLWLASLCVSVEMARAIGDNSKASEWSSYLNKAKQVFVDKLWNGSYFRFCEKSKSRDTVMADQLCGIWFLQSVSPELSATLLPSEYVRSSLGKIFELNVCRFGEGRMGAVNGMRPDGKIDRAYIQADEMWTGVTYAVAAFMIQEGEYQNAFDTAFGSYDACFNRFGLQYQTPEALYEKRFYRAIGYMRPLAVWSMQWALRRHAHFGTSDEDVALSKLRPPPAPPSTASIITADDDGGSEGYGSEEKGIDIETTQCVQENTV